MTALEHTFHVAIFDAFLESFARIPRAQQKKVNDFIRKFRADPTAASINYEKIHSFVDPNLRTVRIGDDYRAIVRKPDRGNVFLLLWVDHHDEAMAWARQKRVAVHPETGSLQVYTLATPAPEGVPAAMPERTAAPEAPRAAAPLFAVFSDLELRSVGVPEPLVPAVRAVLTERDLDRLLGTLPAEAWEALCFLAEGDSLDEVRRALGISAPAAAVANVDEALTLDATRRSFVVVTDDDALAAMLDAPLERWRVFLHPSQRKLVERRWDGPARVLGGAGTGKTVVAMHRAAWLLTKVFTGDDDRLLFTTFTRNLALDIRHNLAALLPSAALRRVEVVHIDKWVTDFLHGRGYRYEIDYWQPGQGRMAELWKQALDLSPGLFVDTFYREEWEYVVQPQGCMSADDYVRAKRKGRGQALSREQRRAIWPVFQEYRNLLEEHGLRESVDAMRDAASLLERPDAVLGYRAILVDEAQDMSTVAFSLLRKMIPEHENDLFIVGDGHQRIYRRSVVLGHAGVKVVGRSHRLRINYRTTDEIRRFAVALLEGLDVDDLDGGADTTRGYRSLLHGPAPSVRVFPDRASEIEAIAGFVGEGDPTRTCLVARTNAVLDACVAGLEAHGVATYRLSRSAAEDPAAPGLRVATMHRVKGLEFDRVVVAGLNADTLPLRSLMASTEDHAVKADIERQERALIYVAVTRAKKEVLLTGSGVGSRWLAGACLG